MYSTEAIIESIRQAIEESVSTAESHRLASLLREETSKLLNERNEGRAFFNF